MREKGSSGLWVVGKSNLWEQRGWFERLKLEKVFRGEGGGKKHSEKG